MTASEIVLATRSHPRHGHEAKKLASKQRGGRAPTGASIHCPRHTRRRYRPRMLRARKRSQRGPLASRRSTAVLAAQINATAQPRPRFARNTMRRRYLRFESRSQRCTSRAGHSAGRSMPKPPGSGVTNSARRNRTRSVSRPSPVTSLRERDAVAKSFGACGCQACYADGARRLSRKFLKDARFVRIADASPTSTPARRTNRKPHSLEKIRKARFPEATRVQIGEGAPTQCRAYKATVSPLTRLAS